MISVSTPRVSVIINCYNGERYLSEALRSVIAQTHPDWELIFWDNKSIDRSKEIFFSFSEQRFRYYEAKEHTTLGMARKLALEKAKGEWIGFLDCDDVWYPDKLERQLAAVDNSEQSVGLVYCDTDFVTSDDEAVWREYTSKGFYGFDHLPVGEIFLRLCESCFFTLVSALINRDMLIKAGGINPNLKHAEDYDIFLKIAAISKVTAVDDACCAYRLHDSNLTWSQHELAYLEPIGLLESYPSNEGIRKALGDWRAAFALWSFRHLSFQYGDVWMRGLLSFSFPKTVVRMLTRKIRQSHCRARRKIAWNRAS